MCYLNMAPFLWFSKHQPTVESSVFGSELVAMKNGIETCRRLHYKFIMMGVTLSGPIFVNGDNMYDVHNTQLQESAPKKKSNFMCYHAVHKPAKSRSPSCTKQQTHRHYSVQNSRSPSCASLQTYRHCSAP
jgi:hypothetical protein